MQSNPRLFFTNGESTRRREKSTRKDSTIFEREKYDSPADLLPIQSDTKIHAHSVKYTSPKQEGMGGEGIG